MNAVKAAFEPFLGKPSWLVKHGHGSFVTLEFGEASVEVGESRLRRWRPRQGDPEMFMGRSAHVHGEWHLWIYCCLWSLSVEGRELAHCESDDITIARALVVLEGQALANVEADVDGRSTFSFDLGCVLSTKPAPPGTYSHEPVDQWLLYQPTGQVLTFRGDGCFRSQDRDDSSDDVEWVRLPADP